MTRIGVRELRQNASRYLEKVKAGETVEVTDRGELVALLIPPTLAATVRDRLIREGRLVPAKAPWALPDLLDIPPGAPSTAEALDEQRADLFDPTGHGPL
jgi:prevent-host-death family protein